MLATVFFGSEISEEPNGKVPYRGKFQWAKVSYSWLNFHSRANFQVYTNFTMLHACKCPCVYILIYYTTISSIDSRGHVKESFLTISSPRLGFGFSFSWW